MNTTLHTQNQQYITSLGRYNKKSSFDEASTIDSHHSVDPQDYKRKFKMEVTSSQLRFVRHGGTMDSAGMEIKYQFNYLSAPLLTDSIS